MIGEDGGLFRAEIREMRKDLDTRFGRYLDVDSDEFSPVFIVGTFLDLRYKSLLSEKQIDVAINCIRQKVIFSL